MSTLEIKIKDTGANPFRSKVEQDIRVENLYETIYFTDTNASIQYGFSKKTGDMKDIIDDVSNEQFTVMPGHYKSGSGQTLKLETGRKLVRDGYDLIARLSRNLTRSSGNFSSDAEYRSVADAVDMIADRREDFFRLHNIKDESSGGDGIPLVHVPRSKVRWETHEDPDGRNRYSAEHIRPVNGIYPMLYMHVSQKDDLYSIEGAITYDGSVLYRSTEAIPADKRDLEDALSTTNKVLVYKAEMFEDMLKMRR